MNKSIKDVQEYWDRRPCNVKHSQRLVGTREYWNEVESRKYRVEPHILGFAEFSKWAGHDVLELGCGIGTDTVSLLRAGAHVDAVDVSEESLALARQRVELLGLTSHAKFYHGDMERLGNLLPQHEKYDLVYAFGSIHHTPSPSRALAEARRFLRPGGELRMMVYNRGSVRVMEILAENDWDFARADALIARHSEAQTGCPVTHCWAELTWCSVLRACGYEPTSVTKAHLFTYDVERYKAGELVTADKWRDVPDSVMARLEREMGWHLLVKARLAT